MRRCLALLPLLVTVAACSEPKADVGPYRPVYAATCQDFGSAATMASMFLTGCTEELNGLKKPGEGASYSMCEMATGEAQAAGKIWSALAPEGVQTIAQACPGQVDDAERYTRVMDWRAKHLDPYLRRETTSLPVFEPAAPAG
jgi:hypothetical protein